MNEYLVASLYVHKQPHISTNILCSRIQQTLSSDIIYSGQMTVFVWTTANDSVDDCVHNHLPLDVRFKFARLHNRVIKFIFDICLPLITPT